MKKKAKTSELPKNSPLNSDQWISESSTGGLTSFQVAQNSKSNSKSNSPSPNPKDKTLKLSVSPDIVCCGDYKTITATATATDPDNPQPDVSLTCPDGTFTGKSSVSHEYQVKDSDCGTWLLFSASGVGKSKTAKVPVIKITFDLPSNPQRIGITVGAHDRTQHFSATIAPSEYASKAAIVKGNFLSVTNARNNPQTGEVTFDAVGVIPGSSKKGDTYLGVKVEICSVRRPVSVVKPAAIPDTHPKHGTFTLTPKNDALNKHTVPAFYNVPSSTDPPDYVKGATLWGTSITIPVVDQFGDSLEHLYDGADISEQEPGNPINPINVALNNSEYSDWIGVNHPSGVVGAPNSKPIQDFLKGPLLDPPAALFFNENFVVFVDGFLLKPPVGRKQTWTPPQTLVFDWP